MYAQRLLAESTLLYRGLLWTERYHLLLPRRDFEGGGVLKEGIVLQNNRYDAFFAD